MDKEQIYQEYGDFVFKYLLTLTNDFHSAEDLAQETFYQAIKSIHKFRDDGSAKFTTWLCAIAKNLWMQEMERERKKNQMLHSLESKNIASDQLENEYIKNEELIQLFKLARKLSSEKREIVYLRLLGGLSFKEIGKVFDKTENWARVTFYRAKLELRKGDDGRGT